MGNPLDVELERGVEATLESDAYIAEILRGGELCTRWQPICSIKKRTIVGFEALSYGRGCDGAIIPPGVLFEAAEEKRVTLRLDRMCRTLAIEHFPEVLAFSPNATLFMNLDTAIIDRGVVGSGHLIQTVERVGLNPRQIVVEVIESRTPNLRALKEFIETYRSLGFLIALDDVGAGHSNLDRIAQLKPDLIKIDRLLVNGIVEYHAREVFRALADLAHATGALVVAEGIEDEAQALNALELGADLLQGYYLAKPCAVTQSLMDTVAVQTGQLAGAFRSHVLGQLQAKADRARRQLEVLEGVAGDISSAWPEAFDTVLLDVLGRYPGIEFVYILTESGVQVSHTIGYARGLSRVRHYLFEPAAPGTDHGLKDYVLMLSGGREYCVTDPYISLASGSICQTCSTRFTAADGATYILCVDLAEIE